MPTPDVRIVHDDALNALASLSDNSIDAVVTDPPYGLSDLAPSKVTGAIVAWASGQRDYVPSGTGFMGREWDRFVPPPALWDEVFRVLKPGGHALVFAGSRTQDIMGLACRLAGFEVRDVAVWGYATGFPKGQKIERLANKRGLEDIAEKYAGWNTQLKPAYEPILVLRKPPTVPGPNGRPKKATVLDTVVEWGTGAINIDATRVTHRNAADLAESVNKNRHGEFGTLHGGNTVYGDYTSGGARTDYDGSKGRYPSNLLFTHAEGCEQLGETRVKAITGTNSGRGAGVNGSVYGDYAGRTDLAHGAPVGYADADGTEPAAVWSCVDGCPVAELDVQSGVTRSVKGKPRSGTRKDDHTFGPESSGFSAAGGPEYDDIGGASRFFWCGKASTKERPVATRTDGTEIRHVSVKPLDLIRQLVRLVTPPDGVVLDVFAGSGTLAEAALLEGFDSISIEADDDSIRLIQTRLAKHNQADDEDTA